MNEMYDYHKMLTIYRIYSCNLPHFANSNTDLFIEVLYSTGVRQTKLR